jgi:hypothetical protein
VSGNRTATRSLASSNLFHEITVAPASRGYKAPVLIPLDRSVYQQLSGVTIDPISAGGNPPGNFLIHKTRTAPSMILEAVPP